MKHLSPFGSKTEQLDLDATNRKILGILQRDGRASYSALADQVHLSTPAVIKRVRRMEQAGVIRGYSADIDPEKIGLSVSVIVRLTCSRSAERRFVDQLPSFPEISECHLMAGDISFVMHANVSSIAHLNDLLHRIGRFGETDSATVLETSRPQGQYPVGVPYEPEHKQRHTQPARSGESTDGT